MYKQPIEMYQTNVKLLLMYNYKNEDEYSIIIMLGTQLHLYIKYVSWDLFYWKRLYEV
jgi:hypothetical protein